MARKLVCTCDLCGKQIYDNVYNLAYTKTSVDNPEDMETYEFDNDADGEFVNPDICADCYNNVIIPSICRTMATQSIRFVQGPTDQPCKNTGSEKCDRRKITVSDVRIMAELKTEGLSNKKISEQIGCSEQTVANYLAKVREGEIL